MRTKRNQLPELCYTVPKTTGEFAFIKKGQMGYFPYSAPNVNAKYEDAEKMALFYNNRLGLNAAQIEAMECGSLFGWDKRAADPQTYFDNAILIDTICITGHLSHPSMSISHPINGNLYRYKIAGTEVQYLDLAALVTVSDYYLRECVGCLSLDLVAGKPLIAVNAQQQKNGTYSLKLANNVASAKEKNAAYYICCRVDVGEVQFVLAYHPSQNASTPYVNWERTPGNERDTDLPNYYWGHYCSDAKAGVEDFVKRVVDKYNWQKFVKIR